LGHISSQAEGQDGDQPRSKAEIGHFGTKKLRWTLLDRRSRWAGTGQRSGDSKIKTSRTRPKVEKGRLGI